MASLFVKYREFLEFQPDPRPIRKAELSFSRRLSSPDVMATDSDFSSDLDLMELLLLQPSSMKTAKKTLQEEGKKGPAAWLSCCKRKFKGEANTGPSAWLICCKRRKDICQMYCKVVLCEDVLTGHILRYTSMGSLQMLSMTSKHWLERAYRLVSEVEVDMASWPFAVTELRKTRDLFGLDFSFDLDSLDGWKSTKLRDSKVKDADLFAALKRFQVPQVARLVLSSSSLSASSFCWALETFSHLRELCLSTGGSSTLGAECQAALEKCCSLESLHLDQVQLRPPSTAKGLKELIVGQRVMQEWWSLGNFQHLRILNLDSNMLHRVVIESEQVPAFLIAEGVRVRAYAWLLETFRCCRFLQEINIYAVTEVTNQLLATLMEHVQDLRKFAGCRQNLMMLGQSIDFPFPDGPRPLSAGDLTLEATEAFKAHFSSASIFIDDVYGEMLLDDDDW